MQILTPSGYQHPFLLSDGEGLVAFRRSGRRIVNRVEHIDFVDYKEWCSWWRHHDILPKFNWVRINGEHVLFGEQSIWRNGNHVCHVRDLVVGDELYDDEDDPFLIESLEVFEDKSRVWYRFEIDGDHSYVVDGIVVHNASRFWVGGTGSLTSSNTTNWAATSGGAGSQSVPGISDTATWDGSSGGGTTTLNFGGTWSVQSVTLGAFTGTWDNSVNNNNVTVSGNFSGTGSGTRTIKLGTATYTLTGNTSTWDFSVATNLTYSGNTGCNIVFSGSTGARGLSSSSSVNLSHGNVTFGASSGAGRCRVNSNNGAITLNSLTITAPNYVEFPAPATTTITNAFNWAGSSSSPIAIASFAISTSATVAAAGSSAASWCSFRDMTFTGSPTASNSFDLGDNSGISISAPSVGGSAVGVIGS